MKSSQTDSFITPSDIRDRAKTVFGGSIGLDTTIPNNTLLESWANHDSVYVNHISDHNNLIWIDKVLKEGRPTIMLCKFDAWTEWFNHGCKTAQLKLVLKEHMKYNKQWAYNHHLAVFLFNTNKHSTIFIEVFADSGYFLS